MFRALSQIVAVTRFSLASLPQRLGSSASAMLGSRVPTAFVVEDRFRIQLDPELVDLRACIWGVDAEATAAGVEVFIDRYLDPFLREAHERV